MVPGHVALKNEEVDQTMSGKQSSKVYQVIVPKLLRREGTRERVALGVSKSRGFYELVDRLLI